MNESYRRGMTEWYVQPLNSDRWPRLRWYALAASILLVVGVGLALFPSLSGDSNVVETVEKPSDVVQNTAVIFVHVVGEVKSPGVYEVPAGSRLTDAISAAGGTSPKADLSSVNLARVLNDGEQIIVAARGATNASGSTSGKINVNTATTDELEKLPGIGPTIASRIVDYRDMNGSFGTVDALADVPGIGPSILDELRKLVTV